MDLLNKKDTDSLWLVTDLEEDKIPKNVSKEDMPAGKKVIIKKGNTPNKRCFSRKKLQSIWAYSELTKYLKAICKDKVDINDITCSANFKFFEPRLYYYLVDLQKKVWLSYQDVVDFFVAWILKDCKQVKWEDRELLIRAIKENDTTCTKEIDKVYKDKYAQLEKMFKNFNLSEESFQKPIEFFYWINSVLTYVKHINLQILILKNLNKQAKEKYGSIENFKNKLLEKVWAESVDDLKQLILKDYENIFTKYNLKDCGLKLEWYKNDIIWVPLENKATVCLAKKLKLEKWFKEDYNLFAHKIYIYTYVTKNFIWDRAYAEVLFGKNGVWIANLLKLKTKINETKKK